VVRGQIAAEVGRACGAAAEGAEPVGVWLSEARCLSGLSGAWPGVVSVWRLITPVSGMSGSSPGWPSVRRRGFMMRFGAPPDPITSG